MLGRDEKDLPDPNWYGYVTYVDPDHMEDAYRISEELLALEKKQSQQLSMRGISKIWGILKSREIRRERTRLDIQLSSVAHRELIGNTEQVHEDISTGLLELNDHQTELYIIAHAIVSGRAKSYPQESSNPLQ